MTEPKSLESLSLKAISGMDKVDKGMRGGRFLDSTKQKRIVVRH